MLVFLTASLFSRAPAPTPSSEFGSPAPTPLEPWLQMSVLSRAPAPTPSSEFGPWLRLLLSSPGSKCPSSLEPRLRLPKNPRSFSPFSAFLYSSANWIFITPIPFRYTTERYIIKRNNNVLTLLSMQSGYVQRQTAVNSSIYWIILNRDYFSYSFTKIRCQSPPLPSLFLPSRVCCPRG